MPIYSSSNSNPCVTITPMLALTGENFAKVRDSDKHAHDSNLLGEGQRNSNVPTQGRADAMQICFS